MNLLQAAEYFSFRTKLADSLPPSSGPISSVPSSVSYRVINFDQFQRVNDDVLDCYIFVIDVEKNKPVWFRKVQITNETFPQIESMVQKILNKFLSENIVGEAKILINTKSTWSSKIELDI